LSATEVNGTALSTGAYPARSGIISNREYRPDIDPLKSIGTEALAAVRKGDDMTQGHYLAMPTIAEIARRAGRKAVVAGAKPVALLADRAPRQTLAQGADVFAGETLPASLREMLTQRLGQFPKEGGGRPTRNDWTTGALLETLWGEGVPDFSLLWLNEPDSAQHATGPGSPRSLAGIRNADDNLGRVLKALDSKGASAATDVMVVSDHGFSTIMAQAELADDLSAAGIKATREFTEKPNPGEVLVVNNSGSALLYVTGHGAKVVEQAVRFLQGWKYSGVIFTRDGLPGTFRLAQAHLDSAASPDVLLSLRWSADRNTNGTTGLIFTEHTGGGPGHGAHVSLSPYDMHNTLVAAGPDFRAGVVSDVPSGNVDVAPTVLHLLGLKPVVAMDGRVLSEALKVSGEAVKPSTPRRLEASAENGKSVWYQYLQISAVNGVEYCDEGNGEQKK
jgi:arylsulfatase A-like enzyme